MSKKIRRKPPKPPKGKRWINDEDFDKMTPVELHAFMVNMREGLRTKGYAKVLDIPDDMLDGLDQNIATLEKQISAQQAQTEMLKLFADLEANRTADHILGTLDRTGIKHFANLPLKSVKGN